MEFQKKIICMNFWDMYELSKHMEQYDSLLREENIKNTSSQGTSYKNPNVSYASASDTEAPYANIDASEIVIDKPFVCKALTHANTKDMKIVLFGWGCDENVKGLYFLY